MENILFFLCFITSIGRNFEQLVILQFKKLNFLFISTVNVIMFQRLVHIIEKRVVFLGTANFYERLKT